MTEFSLHVRLDATDGDSADALLAPYAEAHEDVTLGSASIDHSADDGSVVPETCLEVDDVDTFAEIYRELRAEPTVDRVYLWGPTAERYPLRVEHYALQHLSTPDSYEFYALDGQVTLVISDAKGDLKQARQEVPAAALG